MDTLKEIKGIDRYLLIATALLFVDLPQAVLTLIPGLFLFGWLWGILGSLVFGFILHQAFNVRMFSPRMGLKAIAPFLMEIVPGIGAISLLSVAIFIVSHFHNNNVAEDNQNAGEDAV